MNTAYTIDPASNPKLEHNIQAFLKGLNSGEGKPLEQLSPTEARDVFVGFQASAPHDLAPARHRAQNGRTRPSFLKPDYRSANRGEGKSPCFSCSSTAAVSCWGTSRRMNVLFAIWYPTPSLPLSSSTIHVHPRPSIPQQLI